MIRVFDGKRKDAAAAMVDGFVGELRAHASPAITGAGALETEPGWLYCNGAAVGRDAYARLFEIIGTTFGVGDGATTFNLPDYRGRSLSCALDGQAAGGTRMAATAGTPAGVNGHTLTKAQLPAHSHDKGTLAVPTGGSHTHTSGYTAGPCVANNGFEGANVLKPGFTPVAGSAAAQGQTGGGAHTHPSGEWSGTTDAGTGLGGGQHSNVAPVVGASVVIRY